MYSREIYLVWGSLFKVRINHLDQYRSLALVTVF
jgi:hypothetical protein